MPSQLPPHHSETLDESVIKTPPLQPDERNALRAYLQRCEVRLSTLHRIAVAFISGAGLLLLFPIFFREAITSLAKVWFDQWANVYPDLGTTGWILTFFLFGTLAYPFILSLMIPIFAVYLLLKDVVHFYFSIYAPGFSKDLLNPTFTMSGVAFSVDESPTAKREIWRYQYRSPDLMNFVMPFSESRREQYFDNVVELTDAQIIPASRRLENLYAEEIITEDMDLKNIQRFHVAMGLARTLDRTLIEEVAKTEASLVRHIIYLRRLVLRYIKTLLMFIWTTLISFMMIPFLQDDHISALGVLAVGYLIWSAFVMRVMQLPVRWIYQHNKKLEPPNYREQIDDQLRMLEMRLAPFTRVSIFASLVALILALMTFVA